MSTGELCLQPVSEASSGILLLRQQRGDGEAGDEIGGWGGGTRWGKEIVEKRGVGKKIARTRGESSGNCDC